MLTNEKNIDGPSCKTIDKAQRPFPLTSKTPLKHRLEQRFTASDSTKSLIRFCKEITFATAISGKINHRNSPNYPRKRQPMDPERKAALVARLAAYRECKSKRSRSYDPGPPWRLSIIRVRVTTPDASHPNQKPVEKSSRGNVCVIDRDE